MKIKSSKRLMFDLMKKFYFQKGSTNEIRAVEKTIHYSHPNSMRRHCFLILPKRMQWVGDPMSTLVSDFFPLFPFISLFLHFFAFVLFFVFCTIVALSCSVYQRSFLHMSHTYLNYFSTFLRATIQQEITTNFKLVSGILFFTTMWRFLLSFSL